MKKGTKVLVFDSFGTLFDVDCVTEVSRILFGVKGEEFSKVWRKKQLDYAFLRQLMGRYCNFWEVTKDALHYTAQSLEINLTPDQEERLLETYLYLKPYPEIKEALAQLSSYNRVILSNGTSFMLNSLVEHTKMTDLLEDVVSVNDIKQYKPTAAAYQYLIDRYGLDRREVLFISAHTWDIAGASSFGFKTVWINRKNKVFDHLGVRPDFTYKDLSGLVTLAGR